MRLNSWTQSIADAGRQLLCRSYKVANLREPKSIGDLCSALYSNKGEALGMALASEVTLAYAGLEATERLGFFRLLANDYGPDADQISDCARRFTEQSSAETYRALSQAVEAPRQKLMRRINMAPSGTRTIVNMRRDLLQLTDKEPALHAIDDDFVHLLTSWFNPGFLKLERIDWSTSANVLEKLIEYEAVHEMQGWGDLRRRLDDRDRRCFGFFHPTLPDEPLIFVEVVLVSDIATSIQNLLAQPQDEENRKNQNTAVFYSISNCQPGLKGISFGDFLIKRVVMLLKQELPQLSSFITLSPIPGFTRWLGNLTGRTGREFVSSEDCQLLEHLKSSSWHSDEIVSETLKPLLLSLCAHYFVEERYEAMPIDPVARFHLGNGASIRKLNWLGDTSRKGISQSAGMMVNYHYDLNTVEENHENFYNNTKLSVSKHVTALLK